MKLINRRIFTSLLVIGVLAVAVFGATRAFFSDSETSVGNTLAAGDIDLQIDNESYAIDWNIPGYNNPTGKFVSSSHTSWDLRDLTIERFFDFIDLKPGDYGEDTISVHVGSNDAWVCAAARVTDDNDNTYTDPEEDDDNSVVLASPETKDGELDEEVNFAFWWDDGDNVYENCDDNITNDCRPEEIFLQGPISALGGAGQMALADSSTGNPFPGGSTRYIGKYWCFGNMTEAALPQDGQGKTDGPTNGPLQRSTGFSCNGASVNNAAQTDVIKADLQFYAEQARHNNQFTCKSWEPRWPESENNIHRVSLENKDPQNWETVFDQDDRYGVLTWNGDGPTFNFSSTFNAFGLVPNTGYSLIYAPDPWPQGIGTSNADGTGTDPTVLGKGTSDGSGNLTISNEVNLGYDMPHPFDANYPTGAKIWLVLSADHNDTQMTDWNPDQYLFETVLIHYDDTDVN